MDQAENHDSRSQLVRGIWPFVMKECPETPPHLAGDPGDYPDGSRNEQNKQEQGRQDESVSTTSSKVRKTDQLMDGSQLLKDNSEDQGIRPPHKRVDEFQEWITVADEDAQSGTTTPDDKSAQTLAYLEEAKRFGKRAGDYKTALRVVTDLPTMSRTEVETFTKAINTQLSIEYADLSNDFYANAFPSGEAAICADVREQGQEGRTMEE